MWLHEIKHDGFRVIARKNGNVGKDFGTVPRRTNPVAWW
jgi:ATP-dependent DNA ligase